MNRVIERSSTPRLKIPRDLCEEIGSQEKIIRLIKVGLLSLRATSLEREITDVAKRIEDSKKKIVELPLEVERFQQLLEEALRDQKTLEKLLGEKG